MLKIFNEDHLSNLDSDDEDVQINSSCSKASNTLLQYSAADLQEGQVSTRRRPRKSILQTKPNTEIQFETIAVENGETNLVGYSSSAQNSASRGSKVFKTTPKILAAKPPSALDVIDNACEDFLNCSETKDLMNSIAEERVRINCMLSLAGMPEINFSLYTLFDRLQFQFDERLKLRKMRNWDPTQVQETRLNLQNNTDQETT
ncbi:hypothetical protein GQX74_009525 [Glossina fuscipes]|nr:hypothetical protein GQX74_009525 [Glossina fuscipes]